MGVVKLLCFNPVSEGARGGVRYFLLLGLKFKREICTHSVLEPPLCFQLLTYSPAGASRVRQRLVVPYTVF